MVNQQQITGWKWLKEQINKVRDNTLRFAMLAEFRKRAYKEWGFNPDNGKINTKQEIELDDWEKEFVEDIRKMQMYELDVRAEKRKQTDKEAKAKMKIFISKGGNLKDIPDNIKTKTIEKLYYECLFEYGNEIMDEADFFIKKRFTNDKKDCIIQ